MKKITTLLLASIFIISCSDDIKYDGIIVIDPNTKKEYLLVHSMGKCYFIHEKKIKIVGTDTTYVFTK
jgi:hypothetical protein